MLRLTYWHWGLPLQNVKLNIRGYLLHVVMGVGIKHVIINKNLVVRKS
jgi:hypothetical protein